MVVLEPLEIRALDCVGERPLQRCVLEVGVIVRRPVARGVWALAFRRSFRSRGLFLFLLFLQVLVRDLLHATVDVARFDGFGVPQATALEDLADDGEVQALHGGDELMAVAAIAGRVRAL